MEPEFLVKWVSPIWSGGNRGEDALLKNAYRNSLVLARNKGIRSISFPSISTGAYRFPINQAARIALSTVQKFIKENNFFKEVRFVLFSANDLEAYENAWNEVKKVKIDKEGQVEKR